MIQCSHHLWRVRERGINLAWILKHIQTGSFKSLSKYWSWNRPRSPSPIKSLTVYYRERCPLFWLCKIGNLGPCTLLKYEIIHEWKRWRLWRCQMHSLATVSALNSVLISWLLPIFPWGNKSFWPILPHVPALTKQSHYTRTLFSAYAALKQPRFTRNGQKKKKTQTRKLHLH